MHLAALIASKICHDIISPLSSITYALDLLNEPGDATDKANAQALLEDGASKAEARIEFLRYAFGSLGLSSGAADMHDARRIVEKYARALKPSLEWDIACNHVSFAHARLMMNLVMIGFDCLPRGGVATIRMRSEPNGLQIQLTCKGDRAKLKELVADGLDGTAPPEGWKSDNIHPHFVQLLCTGLGGELTTKQGDGVVTLVASGLRAEG